MIKLVILCLALSTLTACSSYTYKINQDTFWLIVKEDKALNTSGVAVWKKNYCEITLKRYPICLKHEIRHCIEGNWHSNEPNGIDCY